MNDRTNFPLLATLVISLSACTGTVTGDPPGSTTTTSGTGGGGTAGSGGAGGVGGSNTGGGGSAPTCEIHPAWVFACALPTPLPADPTQPWAFVSPGTVTNVRVPDANEPCVISNNYWYTIGWAAPPEVMIDLVDANQNLLTVGVATPGFTLTSVAVGDTLDIDFASMAVEFGGKYAHLRIDRNGQFVVGVGENDPLGLSLSEGPSECYQADDLCGREEFAMNIASPDGTMVSIANGETVDVGGLLVTNDHYFHNYDISGGCNFGIAVEYLVGVAPKTP